MTELLRIGLCADCVFRRTVPGGRSTFYMCQRAFTDPEYPKYPRLPVVACRGYDPGPSGPAEGETHSDKLTG